MGDLEGLEEDDLFEKSQLPTLPGYISLHVYTSQPPDQVSVRTTDTNIPAKYDGGWSEAIGNADDGQLVPEPVRRPRFENLAPRPIW